MTVKLIKHTSECDHEDDPSLPFKLYMTLKPPEFMEFTWFSLYGGSEEIIARGDTLEEVTAWMEKNDLKEHTRLIRYSILDGDGKVVDSWDRHAKPEAKTETNLEGVVEGS